MREGEATQQRLEGHNVRHLKKESCCLPVETYHLLPSVIAPGGDT